jgi:hypothetical protein
LYPPAELELPTALGNYRSYQRSADRWALARLVVPAFRLGELSEALRINEDDQPLALSVVLGTDIARDLAAIEGFRRDEPQARVEALELRAATRRDVRGLLAEVPANGPRYLELPAGELDAAALEAIGVAGAFAKLRAGGITAEAVPAPETVLEFLEAAATQRLGFKATAGLHHALRGTYPLSYAASAPRAELHGFLNLLLAAAILWHGGSRDQARAALLEHQHDAIRATGASLQWRGLSFTAPMLQQLREGFFHSFGSCSFREPLDELATGPWHR